MSSVDMIEKSALGYRPPPDEAKMIWLAQGLKHPIEASMFEKAPPKAGLDAGQNFYVLPAGRLRLALREDGMVAYITEVAAGVNDDEILETLRICNLVDAEIPPGGHLHGLLTKGWVAVCAGQPNREAIWTEYCLPGEPNKILPVDTLKLMSNSLNHLWEHPNIAEAYPGLYCGVSALPGDVLANVHTTMASSKGYDIFGRHLVVLLPDAAQPVAGENVIFENDQFQATCYGHVFLEDNVLSVKPPFWMDRDSTQLYWCLLDSRSRPVTENDVQSFLDQQKIVKGIDQQKIETLLTEIPNGEHTPGAHLIAQGQIPEHGKDAYLELLVDTQKRTGKMREDGSVDFREVDFTPEAKPDAEIARLHPPKPGVDGENLHGEKAPAYQGKMLDIKTNDHVRKEEKEGIIHYYALNEGVVTRTRHALMVLDLLVIDGDINYKTGNLKFSGEIFIRGTVGPSFSVIADGNITVGGNVETGAKLMSKGNVLVGKGISGRKTRVIALGDIQAQFVSESNLQCGHHIYVSNHTSGAHLRAGQRIKVDLKTGQKGGCIIGGEAWASRSVDLHTAGASNQTKTTLNVGLHPDDAVKLEDIDMHLQEANRLIMRYLQRFDLDHVNVQQIQNILAASTGPRKKVLALSAKQLGEAVQAQQRLVRAREEVRAKVDRIQYDAVVIVRDRVMPGVVVRVGDYMDKVLDVVKTPRYKIQNNRLVNR